MARTVTVNANFVVLPDGNIYNDGDTATLTDEQFSRLSSNLFVGGSPLLTNGGYVSGQPVGASSAMQSTALEVTRAERVAVDLDYWFDGNMGFAWNPIANTIIGSAPNGPLNSAWMVGADGSLLDSVVYAELPTAGIIDPDTIYANGGNNFFLPSGQVIAVYHGEELAPGSNPDYTYWSFLGILTYPSPSFVPTDCGRIVTPFAPKDQPGLLRNVEITGGAWAVKDGYFHAFYRETVGESDRRQLSVARCRVTELDAAVATGTVPTFTKWSGAGWTEAGMGGTGADIFDTTTPGDPKWFDVVWLERHNCWMVAYSWFDFDGDVWGLGVRFSTDLINWSPHQTIGTPEAAESIYVTLTSPLTEQSSAFSQHNVPADEVWLFTTRSVNAGTPNGDRWADATVQKHVLVVKSTVDIAGLAVDVAALEA
jgi:hypothetical protein